MRLFAPITLLVTTIAPALAAVDAGQDSDHICNANEVRIYHDSTRFYLLVYLLLDYSDY